MNTKSFDTLADEVAKLRGEKGLRFKDALDSVASSRNLNSEEYRELARALSERSAMRRWKPGRPRPKVSPAVQVPVEVPESLKATVPPPPTEFDFMGSVRHIHYELRHGVRGKR